MFKIYIHKMSNTDHMNDFEDDPQLKPTEDPAPTPPAQNTGSFESGATIIRQHLKTMPIQPGVYRMVAADGTVLYVGKAKILKNRVGSYTQRARLPVRLQRMVARIATLEIVTTHTEAEALLLEANLIQRFMPPYNILLRDDKSYPYILITRDRDFPQLLKHRGAKARKGWYFGPFASGSAVYETLALMQRGFMLRNCSDSYFAGRSRPCLQYHIKRCTAPCVGKVSIEDYDKQVQDAREFLSGKNTNIQQNLAIAMQAASDALEFEKAAILRDRIKVLSTIQSRQGINSASMGDADIIALHQNASHNCVQIFFYRADRNYGTRSYFPAADSSVPPAEIMASFIAQFYSDKEIPPLILVSTLPDDHELLTEALSNKAARAVTITVPKLGEKKHILDHALDNAKTALARKLSDQDTQSKLLQNIAELFGLPEPPKRIEVYDNSHIQGAFAVGAMIAAGPEGFLKKTYRKFNIKKAETNDDFGMMQEVLDRRFRRLAEEDPDRTSGLWPDLLLIDGGQGQTGKVIAALNDLGINDITVVGISKGPDRNAGREKFHMPDREIFSLPPDDPALYYLQRLRDEAHRFAIGTHRAKRAKAISQTGLEEIPGIGAVRKKALLHYFGSAKAVAGAGIADLCRVDGISPEIAKKIYDFYHPGT